MSKDFDPPLGAAAAALDTGDIPEIRSSAADRPPDGWRHEEPQADSSPAAARMLLSPRAGRIGAGVIACLLAGLAVWGLYGFVAPHYARWSGFVAAKFAQMSAPPVDLVPVTQKMEAEIRTLRTKVEILEKARNATTKSLASLEGMNRRIDEAKSETKAGIDALSSRVAAFQQETNTKFAELSAAHAAKKRNAQPVEGKAAPVAEKGRQRQNVPRNDAFDPAQHPNAPGAPRPLGASLDRP